MFENLLSARCDWCKTTLHAVTTESHTLAEFNLRLVSLGYLVSGKADKHYCGVGCEKAHAEELQAGQKEGSRDEV
jgi:hypothetical protein